MEGEAAAGAGGAGDGLDTEATGVADKAMGRGGVLLAAELATFGEDEREGGGTGGLEEREGRHVAAAMGGRRARRWTTRSWMARAREAA